MKTKSRLNIITLFFVSILSITSISFAQGLGLSGRVYEGELGVEPPGSTPLYNVVIRLYASNSSGSLGRVIAQTTTDHAGYYQLPIDTSFEFYTIEEEDPSGYTSVGATTAPGGGTRISPNRIEYNVMRGPISSQVLMGNKFWDKRIGDDPPPDKEMGTIRGSKFQDNNQNGFWDEAEPGIAGWTVNIDNNGDEHPEWVVTTDRQGAYVLNNLEPGRYRIWETMQDGWIQTRPGEPVSYEINLQAGEVAQDYDFGNYRREGGPQEGPGSVTVIKKAEPADDTPFSFVIRNQGSFFDEFQVQLRDPSSNTWPISQPDRLREVAESVPEGWTLRNITITGDMDNGSIKDLTNAKVQVDYDPGENIQIVFTNVRTGSFEPDAQLDFGDAPDSYQTLITSNGARHQKSDLVLGSVFDAETNGQPSVKADGDDNNVLDDEDGLLLPSEQTMTAGQYHEIRIIMDNTGTNAKTGMLAAWIDFDGNGSWNTMNEHIDTKPVYIPGNNTGVHDFKFTVPTNAKAGQTYARFRLFEYEQETGVAFLALPFGDGGKGEVEDYLITIKPPTTLEPQGSLIGGLKYNDLDGNGQRDPLEPGMSGWTFWLDANGDGIPVRTTVSDPNGHWGFDNVTAGHYTIGEQLKPGWTQTSPGGAGTFNVTVPGGPQPIVVYTEVGNARINEPDKPTPEIKWSQPPLPYDSLPEANEAPIFCGWDEPSHSVQRPQERRIWNMVADDFRCLGPIPITSIHWWGSYEGWNTFNMPEQQPEAWIISFWSNFPEDVITDYSFPEVLLHQIEIPTERVFISPIGFDEFPQHPAETCFDYFLELEEHEWFHQAEHESPGDIFWISITAKYPNNSQVGYPWGWKTRPAAWMDAAVRFNGPEEGPYPKMSLSPHAFSPIISSSLCAEAARYDMAFELHTTHPWIKWNQPFTNLMDWPYYEDLESMAIEDLSGDRSIGQQAFDDWTCDRQDPVVAISWNGSYKGYTYEACSCNNGPNPRRPDAFELTIWTHESPTSSIPFDHPGFQTWTYKTNQFDEILVGHDMTSHNSAQEAVYRYSVRLPEDDWFIQTDANERFWLSITAVYENVTADDILYPWGWTNHQHLHGSTVVAVTSAHSSPTWSQQYDPSGEQVDMSFTLYTIPSGPPPEIVEVAETIRDRLLGGQFTGQVIWMTPEPIDSRFTIRDLRQEYPDIYVPDEGRWWVAMVDPTHMANWGHKVLWALVHENLDVVLPFEGKEFPPVILTEDGEEFPFECWELGLEGLAPCPDDYDPLRVPWTEVERVNDCLHAILISGGINVKGNKSRYAENLSNMYRILRHCGAPPENIWTYYATGTALDLDNADGDNNHNTGDDVTDFADKTTIRSQISTLRDTLDPSRDILLIFTSNHGADNEGLCLWDLNSNGKLDNGEIYTPTELAADTANAMVKRLVMILDQCYSGEFLSIATDGKHANSAVYVSASASEPSYGRQYMAHWEQFDPITTTLNQMHPTSKFPNLLHPSCLYQSCTSTPAMAEGTKGNGDIYLCDCTYDLPDLIPVKGSNRSTLCDLDGQGNLIVHVKNQGQGQANGAEVEVRFQVAPGFFQTVRGAHGPIAPGKTDTVSIPIPSGCYNPDCNFTITVDIINQIKESVESNNRVTGLCIG
ncbi:SdrD B-like domain-containing protein [Planctomycetota bacterium]